MYAMTRIHRQPCRRRVRLCYDCSHFWLPWRQPLRSLSFFRGGATTSPVEVAASSSDNICCINASFNPDRNGVTVTTICGIPMDFHGSRDQIVEVLSIRWLISYRQLVLLVFYVTYELARL